MSSIKVEEFFNFHIGSIAIHSWDNSISFSSSIVSRKMTQNKYACYSLEENNARASEFIHDCSEYITTNAGEKLYISPDVKTSRDLIRNGGYKIVRDPENADHIVIPKMRDDCPIFSFDLLVKNNDTNELFCFTVDRNMKYRSKQSPTPEGDFELIKNHFSKTGDYTVLQDRLLRNHIIELIPKCEEYKTILETCDTPYTNYKYIEEQEIEIEYPNVISLETLQLWDKYDDDEILARTICTSNWKDYPVTLLCFLLKEKPWIHQYGGNNFKLVLQSIGYEGYTALDTLLKDKEISPKDWNMLQEWIMSKLGLPPEGGFVSEDVFMKNEMTWAKNFVYLKAAIKPLKIQSTQMFSNLSSILSYT